MAYRFNSGMGGVTCDNCNVLIDQGLSYAEYEASWGKRGPGRDNGDFCMACKEGRKRGETKPSKAAIKATNRC
jgi:hypothetical protein